MSIQTREELLDALQRLKPELQRRWPIESIGLFGSWARGEATPQSDVDLLVNFSGRITLFDFVEIKQQLEEWLECTVDLVDKSAVNPRLAPYILPEVISL